jgi:integrase
MATIITKPRNAKPYTVRYRLDGRQREKSFMSKGEAKRFMASLGRATDCPTFAEYATKWNDQTGLNKTPRSVRNNERMFRLHIFPEIGHLPLDKVTPEICTDLILDPDKTPSMRWHIRKLLAAVFNSAVKQHKVDYNPAKHVEVKYDSKRAEIPNVTYAQLCAIEREIGPEGLAVWLMYGAGLRAGEALAVKASCVQENETVLRISEQVIHARKPGEPLVCPLKARAEGEDRVIPLSPWLAERIREHVAKYGIAPDGYLFPRFAEDNNRMSNGAFRNRFKRGAKKAGCPGLFMHALRHLYVSNLLAANVPIDAVARFVGHGSIELTYSTYGHLVKSSIDQSREAGDRAWSSFKAA